MASRGRRWCWRLAGVVSCGTATSVVLVASHHHQGCLLRSGPWSLNLLWSRVAPLILLSQRQSWLECGSEMWSARRPGWLFAAAIEPRGRQPEDTRGPRWPKLAPEGNMNGGRSSPPRLAAAFCVAACSARWAP